MSSSSTNKTPLLMDRPLLVVRRLDATTSPVATIDPGTSSNGVLLVDCTANDGALVEDVWLIQRVDGNTTPVNLYLATNALLLGSTTTDGSAGAWFVGRANFAGGQPPGSHVSFRLPKILAPVPHAGENNTVSDEIPQFRGLRIAKGLALWAAAESASVVPDAPSIGAQGGYY